MNERNPQPDDEELVGRLIEAAGRGPTASEQARQRVYASVRTEWRRALASADGPARARAGAWRRWFAPVPAGAFATAGVIAAAVLLAYVTRGPATGPAEAIGAIARVEGEAHWLRAGEDRSIAPGDAGISIRDGDVLTTGASDRIAVALDNGISLRVGSSSELRAESLDSLRLIRGTVYLDTGPNGAVGPATRVETALGTVMHVGTQYEVHVQGAELRVRIREGEIAIRNSAGNPGSASGDLVGAAGEQVSIRGDGSVARSAFAPSDAQWEWVEQLAVVDDDADRGLRDLLGWISRETGRQLRFSDPAAEQRVDALTLSGIAGLTPAESLDVVVSTTDLDYRITDDRIEVSAR